MKKTVTVLVGLGLLGGCGSIGTTAVQTLRQTPYYLSTEATQVQDTCPGHDILKQYNCSEEDAPDMQCLDVYMVQGSPAPQQRYTLLQETIEKQAVTPQPLCPKMQPTCQSFLEALKYNLEFSWYLVNFPSSSFEQCRETYDCKRIDCYLAPADAAGQTEATLVSCVFKRNQLFFVGAEVTCRQPAP